ncbi:MAG: hypothetical protein ACPGVU_24225, partial [Limisphaerales bacterium]
MKPGDNHELLDTILEDAEGRAPSADQVLAEIRSEKSGRANRRMIGGTMVSALLVALFITQSGVQSPRPDTPVIHASTNVAPPAPAEPIGSARSDAAPEFEWKIARVDDQQLLDLLVDTPVALS